MEKFNYKFLRKNLIGVKVLIFFIFIFVFSFTFEMIASADSGEMFYFGGVTEGSKLEKTIDNKVTTKSSTSQTKSYTYKEIVALDGSLNVVECTMTIKTSGQIKDDSGSYTVTYDINSVTGSEVTLSRSISFNVKYRIVDRQTIKDYTVTKWTEKIIIGETTYTLDSDKSTLNLPTIEYEAPAITYFKTVISNELVYLDESENKFVVTHTGQSFGYNTHYSSVETQNIEMKIDNYTNKSSGTNASYETYPDDTMIINLKPSVKMNKTLTYDTNTPYAIAFDGNYLELIKNSGGLTYEVVKEQQNSNLTKSELNGVISLPTFNETEILIAPKNIAIWNGNFAEEDIKKLFSMEILEGDTSYYVPNQALTRSQFVRMIVKALGYDPYSDDKEMAIFEDVTTSHVNYGYVIKAWEIGLIYGRGDAHFNPDETINREEAFVIYMRALQLSNKANYNTSITPFIDDEKISLWAKTDIMALYNLGLVKGDSGYIKPKNKISKAEGAALVNRLVDYLREGIEDDYIENLINY